ncbi:osmotically inducible protein OsmC [Achromatium sp. WMS2]|nr:osmotically inducible protein OsmC [Achromatium sp. WMS2]
MADIIEVSFPGGKRVDAQVGQFLIQTDQSVKAGGTASAPEPFSLFLASIATCAGIFALGFCQSRQIDSTGLGLRMACTWDPLRKLYGTMELRLTLPPGFPAKYRDSIVKAVDLCAVKRHMMETPEFKVTLQN